MTVRACVYARRALTMFGPMTSSPIGLTMEGRTGCCASSTSSPARAWRSVSHASSKPPMSSRRSAISSSRGAFQRTSAQTTGPSSWLWPFDIGSRPSEPGPLTLNLAAHGKTDIGKLQRQAARRTAQRRNLLHIKGGKDRDRRLAAALQQGASSLVTRLSASSAGGDRLASTEASGANARSKLTSQTDHSVGAGQAAPAEAPPNKINVVIKNTPRTYNQIHLPR